MSHDTTALLAHAAPSAVVAYRRGVPVSAGEFLAAARRLAELLPPADHVLNVCTDRYRFTVGLAACLITGRVSLLPSTHTPAVIRQMAQFAPDVFCLTDDRDCGIELPRFEFPVGLCAAPRPWEVPQVPDSQLAAIVFTSGSTGTPLPHRKTWGKLARCVRDGAPRLGLLDGSAHTLIGTVPAQHMYGLESTVLLALQSGNAFGAERPFYPADISAAVAAVPRPRALISTPVHLRALLAGAVELPPIDLIVSATAPLPQALAAAVESKFATRVLEIYGSTETGQIATRRTTESAAWRLWPQVHLLSHGDQVRAQGGHVEQSTVLCDVIDIIGDEEFLLRGRSADLVNVAGKRSSFRYLDTQLQAIPGVVDGAFFLRAAESAGDTGVARLAAAVVAPTVSAAELLQQLRQRIDRVFLPRPLLFVERLPRNATGKLPQHSLQALVQRQAGGGAVTPESAEPAEPAEPVEPVEPVGKDRIAPTISIALEIPDDHPAFAGHFPGRPILPGAALLDEALEAIGQSLGRDVMGWQLTTAKFLGTVRPGDALILEHYAPDGATIRFAIRCSNRTVATGTLAHGA